ncbi:MAG: prolipoprotein diacylglyceryl transferase [Candidatus Kapabacteria bacterium]|nr:prolipoprotein diacylglyceryl transferase [Candidatus Kapabacteria bacterium]
MEIFASIVWSVSPEIIQLGPIHIRWYGLLFALGFILGYTIMSWIFKVENKSPKALESLTIYLVLGTVIGARLGHCLFYEPDYYLSNPIEILYVWKGGLASHGAGIGILLALLLFHLRFKDIKLLWLFDRVVIPVALAAFLVRMGNLFNSEIIGRPADVPWAFIFTSVDNIPRHPSQLYEGISYLVIFIIIFFIYKKYKANLPTGRLAGIFLTLLFSARFVIEFFKETQADFEKTLPLYMGQFLSIPFILLGLYFLFYSFKKAKN